MPAGRKGCLWAAGWSQQLALPRENGRHYYFPKKKRKTGRENYQYSRQSRCLLVRLVGGLSLRWPYQFYIPDRRGEASGHHPVAPECAHTEQSRGRAPRMLHRAGTVGALRAGAVCASLVSLLYVLATSGGDAIAPKRSESMRAAVGSCGNQVSLAKLGVREIASMGKSLTTKEPFYHHDQTMELCAMRESSTDNLYPGYAVIKGCEVSDSYHERPGEFKEEFKHHSVWPVHFTFCTRSQSTVATFKRFLDFSSISFSPSTILSYASSAGVEAVELQAHYKFASVHGFDVDPEVIGVANQKYGSYCSCRGDPIKYTHDRSSLTDHSFELIFANHFLAEMRLLPGVRQRIVDDLASLLAPGGWIMVSVFDDAMGQEAGEMLWEKFDGLCTVLAYFEPNHAWPVDVTMQGAEKLILCRDVPREH
jgi:hypothetical protein